jgi:hypothetical protein
VDVTEDMPLEGGGGEGGGRRGGGEGGGMRGEEGEEGMSINIRYSFH